jgi:hypothetical protein
MTDVWPVELRGGPSHRYTAELRLTDLPGDQLLDVTHGNSEVSVRVHGVLRVVESTGADTINTRAKTPPRNLANCLC